MEKLICAGRWVEKGAMVSEVVQIIKTTAGTSLMAQWLRPRSPCLKSRGPKFDPWSGTRFYTPQLKILLAATNLLMPLGCSFVDLFIHLTYVY